ncbi:unnamed protein product [Penicillium glandicola]
MSIEYHLARTTWAFLNSGDMFTSPWTIRRRTLYPDADELDDDLEAMSTKFEILTSPTQMAKEKLLGCLPELLALKIMRIATSLRAINNTICVHVAANSGFEEIPHSSGQTPKVLGKAKCEN